MRFFKTALILLIIVAILSSPFVTCAHKPENPIVGVKPGDWAKYVGSPPYEEYEWMLVSVLNVEETKVSISLSYDLRPPYRSMQRYQRSQTIDVASGRNNLFLFFISNNLTVGDIISMPSNYPKLIINGTDLREYAGLERTVVYASSLNMPWGGAGTLYWDRETGLLVEVLAKFGNSSFSSLRLIETNIWSISLMDWIASNIVFMALVVGIVALSMSLPLIFIRKGKIAKWSAAEVQPERELIRETYPPFRQTLEPLYYFLRPHVGKMLMGSGLSLFVIGIFNLTLFNQVVSSLSFLFAVVLLVVGVLAHSEAWAGNRLKVDVGVIMISLAVVLFGVVAICAMYREIGALVPYEEVVGFGPMSQTVKDILKIEAVFLYPYAWLVSPLATVAFCLVVYGIFFKILYGS